MTKEIWKEVPNYEGDYMISSRGRVKSLNYARSGKEGILKSNIVAQYLANTLSKEGRKKTIRVHQLVAMAFLNHTPCGHDVEVNHIDGNKLNNNLSNLELLTNEQHKAKSVNKTSSYLGVYKANNMWRAQMYINGKNKYIGNFKTELEAHHAYQKKLKEITKNN